MWAHRWDFLRLPLTMLALAPFLKTGRICRKSPQKRVGMPSIGILRPVMSCRVRSTASNTDLCESLFPDSVVDGNGKCINSPFLTVYQQLNYQSCVIFIFVDYSNSRIQIVSEYFEYKSEFGKDILHYPRDVKLYKDNIFILDQSNPCLHIFKSRRSSVTEECCY